jgi:hypothetical protein
MKRYKCSRNLIFPYQLSKINMSNNVDKDSDAELQVPESKKNEFSGFLKTLSTFTGDIYSLTCPSFLLSGVSTLEYGYANRFFWFYFFQLI